MQGRTNRVIRNFIYGIGSQIILTLFPFISRTIFIKCLGVEYLGINGLFASILVMLSLAELGIGNVVIFSLYKPVAENDYERISALLNFYKVLYRSIATVVFVVGIVLIPFLKYLVNLPNGMDHITLYYILHLSTTALSYLYVYKVSIIRANQEQYIVTLYTTVSTILMYILQIIVLLVGHSYVMYLVIQVVFTFGSNFMLSKKAEKLYPYLNEYDAHLSKKEIKELVPSMFSMLLFKIEDAVVNSTDNLYISSLVGTKEVGLFSNYISLRATLSKMVHIIYDAVYTSVGNLNASGTYEQEKDVFDKLMYFFAGAASFVAVGLYITSSDIISVWLGSEFVIDNLSVFALSLNLFIVIYLYPVWMYRNTTGIFNYTKKALIGSMILNIVLSLALGVWIGLAGILLATAISRLLSTFWYEPLILYKKLFFKDRVIEYFFFFIKTIVIAGISIFVITIIKDNIHAVWERIIFEIVACSVIQNGLFIMLNKHKYFRFFCSIITNKLKSRKK